MTVRYRLAAPGDRAFIVTNWEASYRKAHTSGMILMEDWPRIMAEQIEKVLDRPYVRTFVAYNPDAEPGVGDLHGFIVSEPDELPPIVYYAYVSLPFRRSHIARGLFRAAEIDPSLPFSYVCSTPIIPHLSSKIPLARWRPIPARYSKEHRKREEHR